MTHAQKHMIATIKKRYDASQVHVSQGKYNDYWLEVRVSTPRTYDKLVLHKALESHTEALAIVEAYNYAMKTKPVKRDNTVYREAVGIGV